MKRSLRAPARALETATSVEYAVARLFLMIEAFATGRLAASRDELDWAMGLVDDLDLPEEILAEAKTDHDEMVGDEDRVE